MKIYIYKMTCDNGGAPCVQRGLLSLAICKPSIRKRAKEGDKIFGIGGKNLDSRLIYIAEITEKLAGADYYTNPIYAKRRDCIYTKRDDGRAELRSDARYHNDPMNPQITHDVGEKFERASVLLSSNFRYFGASKTTEHQERPQIAAFLQKLRRGHRVIDVSNSNPEHPLVQEFSALQSELEAKFPNAFDGRPSEADHSCLCNR